MSFESSALSFVLLNVSETASEAFFADFFTASAPLVNVLFTAFLASSYAVSVLFTIVSVVFCIHSQPSTDPNFDQSKFFILSSMPPCNLRLDESALEPGQDSQYC